MKKTGMKNRIYGIILVFVLAVTSVGLFPKAQAVHAADSITINLGGPAFLEGSLTNFKLSAAEITGDGITASMTVNVTNGYIVDTDMEHAIADKYTQHQTITWLWSNPKTMAEVTEFLRSITFVYADPMTITITIDENETSIPNGTTVTSYTPAGETSPHYYMYVPYDANPELGHSWLDAYEDAKKQVFMGMIGYLVTLMTPEENAVLDRINNIGAWGGALRLTQASINNGLDKAGTSTYVSTGKNAGAGTTWVWVCGPEAGQTISIPATSAAAKAGVDNYGQVTGYGNWNDGQPDGGGSTAEYCLQVHHNNTGFWNDLPTTYNDLCKGYFVEFSVYEPVAGAYGGTVESYSPDKRASAATTIGHNWFVADKKQNSITAYCNSTSDESVCVYHDAECSLTVSIEAQDKDYNGLPYAGCTITGLSAYNTAMHTSLSAASLKYYAVDDDGHDVLLDTVPVEIGCYKAKLEVFDTTLVECFEIKENLSSSIQPECRTIMSNGAVIGWEPMTDTGVTGYRIDIATDPLFENPVAGYDNKLISGRTTDSITVTGLNPKTEYYFRMRIEESTGTSELNSRTRSFETLAAGSAAEQGTDKEVRGDRERFTVGDDGMLPVGLLYGEIDYDTDFINDDILYATNSEGNAVKTTYINLTTEKFATNFNYTYYSINGGKTWTKAKTKIDDKKFQSLLKKGFTLWLTDSYDSKKKTTGEVLKFVTVQKRPAMATLKVNYLKYADPSGITNGMWTVFLKDTEVSLHSYLIGITDAKGKNIGEKGYGLWPYEDGVWVAPLSDGKQVKQKYLMKTAPHGNVPASLAKKITVLGVAKPTKTKVNYSYENLSLNLKNVIYFAGNKELIEAGEAEGKVYVNYLEDTRADKTRLFRDTDTLPYTELGSNPSAASDYFGKLYKVGNDKKAKMDLSKYITNENRNILVSWKLAEESKPASEKQIIILCKAASAPSESVTVKSGSVKLSVSKTVKYQVLVNGKWKSTVPKDNKSVIFSIRQKMTAKGGKENDTTFATGDEGFMVVEYGLIKAGKTADKNVYGYTKTYMFATLEEANEKLAELNSPQP